jgi:hypothetical protein
MSMPETHMDPVNAVGRFLLELVAAYGIGAGIRQATGSWIVAVPVVAVALVVWGRFRVPDDPGPAPRPVSGTVRLAIEAVILGGGVAGVWSVHGAAAGAVFLAVLVAHYATTPRRLRHVRSFR